jgi:hypothetical protein
MLESTSWVNVDVTKSVNFYFTLLESSKTEPYPTLAKELKKLPYLFNASAIAKITYLALNATNPEVKEAFELMIRGGTPDQSDFSYPVPKYNTELEVLYWLALQNEFKKDDTLALAIAMTNGFWATTGNEQVREALKHDIIDVIIFYRETNGLQTQRGYFQLEKYPLEAKIMLGWLGPSNNLCSWATHRLQHYVREKVNLHDYLWNVANVSTLRAMRKEMDRMNWINSDVNIVTANLEQYFWFTGDMLTLPHWHWVYTDQISETDTATIDGEKTNLVGFRNMNWMFSYYLETGKGVGACIDEAPFIRTWLLSWGMSANSVDIENKEVGHTYAIYFDPLANSWKAYSGQLNGGAGAHASFTLQTDLYIFKPPTLQGRYFTIAGRGSTGVPYDVGSDHIIKGTTLESIRDLFSAGVDSPQMRHWVMYD